jgi:hypothetical protein
MMKRLQRLAALPAILIAAPCVADGAAKMHPFSLSLSCDEWTSEEPSFCSVIESNVVALKKGTKILFYGPVVDRTSFSSSNVVLDDGVGDTAIGNCIMDYEAMKGMCAFHAGNGSVAGFTAIAEASTDDDRVWHWNGSYSLSPSAQASK